MQALAGEVRELSATIQELRGEVVRSRQETREMREQLNGAIEKLSATAATFGSGRTSSVAAAENRAAVPEQASAPAAEVETKTPTEERLSRLEEDQQMLQAKVDEQHQTKVESASKYRVKLSGIALFNLFGNSGAVDNQDVPGVALPPGDLATTGSVGSPGTELEFAL